MKSHEITLCKLDSGFGEYKNFMTVHLMYLGRQTKLCTAETAESEKFE